MNDGILNLMDVCRNGSRALGPGLRYIIWTQGCPFHCKGCISPESRPVIKRNMVDVDLMATDIINRPQVEGITISGGEPMLQASSLIRLLKLVKQQRPELTVIIFTGYKIEALKSQEHQTLLAMTDVLIDGPFEQKDVAHRGLRGSKNQRIHFLTDKLLSHHEELENGERRLETLITDGALVTIGIPNEDQLQTLQKNY